ncbi:actin maturation protease isoform X1 [Scyliorhinus torazame]|uniref:actin maturation protease isoform X1 n=1 Tax=Scyliorhinus torazame TaxID=75743 RepID=UPI003B5B7C9A
MSNIEMAHELRANPSEDRSDGSEWLAPPPPPPLSFLPPPLVPPRKNLYQILAGERMPVIGDREEVKMLLQNRADSFSKELNWLLINKYVPSLIQDGPQCGLVALWMAGHLLNTCEVRDLEGIVDCAKARGYTVQGEMFSGADMVKLAEEVFQCHGELLHEGLTGSNKARIMQHLLAGYPVLLPYDEDFNHEPCLRKGHRAHWAVVSGVLLGLKCGLPKDFYEEDPDTPRLFHRRVSAPEASYPENCVVETHLLAKQGKSLKYQLWQYELVHQSNVQLREFSPKRECDGTVYMVPDGGVESGLCGAVVLLQPLSQEQNKS